MTTTNATRRRGGRTLVGVAVLLLALTGALGPAAAQTEAGPTTPAPERVGTVDLEDFAPRIGDRTGAPPRGASTQIVGGTTAPAGAYPSQAGLIRRGWSTSSGQFCGGTVIDRSWILTAAHCVNDPESGWFPSPSQVDVLVGSQSLTGGGTRIPAVEFRVHPGWNRSLIRNDVALIRLDRPVPDGTPLQPIAPTGPAPAAGTIETAAGWGDQADQAGNYPTQLRHVDLYAQSPSGCKSYFDTLFQASYFDTTSQICGWASGKGTCQGDSGGPVYAGGIQVGIVSWGVVCGQDPSVFARVSTFSTWIRWQVRYGPQPNANAFVKRQYLDLFGRQPTNTELFYGVAGLEDGQTPAAFTAGLLDGDAYNRRTGAVIRLYRAIFLRSPETGGLAYWAAEANRGVSLKRIADLMVRAPEFDILYGDLDDGEFVDLVYDNVLHREASEEDRAYWVDELQSGRRSRGQVMVGFSESPEYKGAEAALVRVYGAFFGLVRRAPSNAERDQWSDQTTLATTTFLLKSFSYANRF